MSAPQSDIDKASWALAQMFIKEGPNMEWFLNHLWRHPELMEKLPAGSDKVKSFARMNQMLKEMTK